MNTEVRAIMIDLGGVLIHDPIHELITEINRQSPLEYREIEIWYREEIRYPLWSGAISEAAFWQEVVVKLEPGQDVDDLRNYLINSCRLLPAASRINDLTSIGPVFVISNHRHEWARPILEEHDLEKHIEDIFISSETGFVKPDRDAFLHAIGEMSIEPEEILYIDDQEKNLDTAASLRINTLIADPDGDWLDEIYV